MRHFSIVVDPEWGGERHGPFTSPMRLGSDPRRCAMSLRSDLPVAGIHLTLEPSPNEWELVLVPHANAPVYLWRNDRPWAIVEPCRIQHGEYFSLISPVGPRMRLEMHSGSGKRAEPTRNSKRKAWIGLGLGVSFLCG